jgi:hypothetical protein
MPYLNSTLKKLKDVQSDCCVTILYETHPHLPDNEKDSLELKNLIKEAESKLMTVCGKEKSALIMDKINDLAADIGHKGALQSIVLFVNENIAEYVRMPVNISQDKVTVGKTFQIRELLRALHQEPNYYLLVLSRDRARMIEALGNKEVMEITDGFPLDNSFKVPDSDASLENGAFSQFFNRVDEQLNKTLLENRLPVFISTEESNFPEFLKISDHKEWIKGFIPGNNEGDKAENIILNAWSAVKKWNDQKNHQRLEELDQAVGAKLFLTDFTEIWRAILEGRGRTLFVKQGYSRPAKLENNVVQLVSAENAQEANVEDIIGEMIEKNIDFGGDAVFVDGNELERYDGLVLVTRY